MVRWYPVGQASGNGFPLGGRCFPLLRAEVALAAFNFELGFQRSVLRLMMRDELFCMRCCVLVRSGFFTVEPLGWIFTCLKAYWDERAQPLTDVVLRNAALRVGSEKLALYTSEVESVIACAEVPEHIWVKEQLADFCKRNMFAIAHEESAKLFNLGKSVEAYDVMAAAQDAMLKVEFGEIDRQWLAEELPQRQRARLARALHRRGFFTGIPELDRATEGVQPGEVWAVFSYAKIGKTTWLVNQGYNAVRMAKAPVLHVVLEGGGDNVPARYDALFSNSLFARVKQGDIEQSRYFELEEEYSYMRRLVVIRRINTWDTNITHVQQELRDLRGHNFRPRLLILDYVDLLRSRYRVDGETQHQVESSRDLKLLADRDELACWTAWQAQRPRENAHNVQHVLTSSNVADAYAKTRIVDAFGSLNYTNAEKARGEMRVYWEAHRSADISKLWVVSNDLSRSRMVLGVLAAVEPGVEKA